MSKLLAVFITLDIRLISESIFVLKAFFAVGAFPLVGTLLVVEVLFFPGTGPISVHTKSSDHGFWQETGIRKATRSVRRALLHDHTRSHQSLEAQGMTLGEDPASYFCRQKMALFPGIAGRPLTALRDQHGD